MKVKAASGRLAGNGLFGVVLAYFSGLMTTGKLHGKPCRTPRKPPKPGQRTNAPGMARCHAGDRPWCRRHARRRGAGRLPGGRPGHRAGGQREFPSPCWRRSAGWPCCAWRWRFSPTRNRSRQVQPHVALHADIMSRLLAAGPALLRGKHSGVLACDVVDRWRPSDGLFGRWVPAAHLPCRPAAGAGGGAVGRSRRRRHPGRRGIAGAGRHGAAGSGPPPPRAPVPGTRPAPGRLPRPHPRHFHHRAGRPRRGRGPGARRGGGGIARAHHAGAAGRLPVLGGAGLRHRRWC